MFLYTSCCLLACAVALGILTARALVHRTRMAGVLALLAAYHCLLLAVAAANLFIRIAAGSYHPTAEAFLMLAVFCAMAAYPTAFAALRNIPHLAAFAAAFALAGGAAAAAKIAFDPLWPDIVLLAALAHAAALGLAQGPAMDRKVRASALCLAVGLPFVLIDLFSESAMRISGNPLRLGSMVFTPLLTVGFGALAVTLTWRVPRDAPPTREGAGPAASADLGLSRREGQIASAVLEGKSNAEIAADLFVSESTVKKHLNRIFRKLRVPSRHRLAVRLRDAGWRKGPPT